MVENIGNVEAAGKVHADSALLGKKPPQQNKSEQANLQQSDTQQQQKGQAGARNQNAAQNQQKQNQQHSQQDSEQHNQQGAQAKDSQNAKIIDDKVALKARQIAQTDISARAPLNANLSKQAVENLTSPAARTAKNLAGQSKTPVAWPQDKISVTQKSLTLNAKIVKTAKVEIGVRLPAQTGQNLPAGQAGVKAVAVTGKVAPEISPLRPNAQNANLQNQQGAQVRQNVNLQNQPQNIKANLTGQNITGQNPTGQNAQTQTSQSGQAQKNTQSHQAQTQAGSGSRSGAQTQAQSGTANQTATPATAQKSQPIYDIAQNATGNPKAKIEQATLSPQANRTQNLATPPNPQGEGGRQIQAGQAGQNAQAQNLTSPERLLQNTALSGGKINEGAILRAPLLLNFPNPDSASADLFAARQAIFQIRHLVEKKYPQIWQAFQSSFPDPNKANFLGQIIRYLTHAPHAQTGAKLQTDWLEQIITSRFIGQIAPNVRRQLKNQSEKLQQLSSQIFSDQEGQDWRRLFLPLLGGKQINLMRLYLPYQKSKDKKPLVKKEPLQKSRFVLSFDFEHFGMLEIDIYRHLDNQIYLVVRSMNLLGKQDMALIRHIYYQTIQAMGFKGRIAFQQSKILVDAHPHHDDYNL